MPIFFGIFHCKCRDDGELPLKRDDFLLKSGRLLLQSESRPGACWPEGAGEPAHGERIP